MPTEQLAKISRYVGAGGGAPTLSKLGGTRWDTLKARARRAAQELAGELLNLYAERKRRSGHAFEPDGDWQREFEERFPYTETPDQRDAIERRQGGHGGAAPDGPPGLRRRRLRQDGGRAARRVQGRGRRAPGPRARADDDPRPAALRHVRRAPEGLPVHDRARQPLPLRQGAEGGDRGLRRRARRHPHRHPPPAEPRRPREGPRAAHRRRGAALRREAEGAAAPAQAEGRRHLDERDADPAHAADVARRHPRHLGHRDAAGGPPPGQDVRRRVRRGPGPPGARSARATARARRSSCTTASRRSTRPPSACAASART